MLMTFFTSTLTVRQEARLVHIY